MVSSDLNEEPGATLTRNTEDAAFNMVRKIHRKLPPGGILVFLTGKQEITRMVRRLRSCLTSRESPSDKYEMDEKELDLSTIDVNNTPRGLDEDDADAEIFLEDGVEGDEDTKLSRMEQDSLDSLDGKGAQNALVLPLQ